MCWLSMAGATEKTKRVTDTVAADQSASTAGQRKTIGHLIGMTDPGETSNLTELADKAAGAQSPETVGDQGHGIAEGLHLESVRDHRQESAGNSLTGHQRRAEGRRRKAEGSVPDQGLQRKKKPS